MEEKREEERRKERNRKRKEGSDEGGKEGKKEEILNYEKNKYDFVVNESILHHS